MLNNTFHTSNVCIIEFISYQVIRFIAVTIAQKIKKEAKKPDSILDLHGYTLQSAYETFIKFITNNYYSHKRTLLVITGKGDPSKQTGTIRREFEKWINSEEIKQLILYVELAPYKTQNNGAFYIYLRK